jgi:hypothetical protein
LKSLGRTASGQAIKGVQCEKSEAHQYAMKVISEMIGAGKAPETEPTAPGTPSHKQAEAIAKLNARLFEYFRKVDM